MNGLINIYKEKGYTSHDVVAIARKKLRTKKVGHAGTLDPDAEGILTLCIGGATKAVEYMTDKDKEYKAVVKLGVITETEDITGEVVEKREVPKLSREEIEEVVNSFLGDYMQVPPMYSAIKVNGKKLYELAREGKVIERKPRKVTINKIELTSVISDDEFEIVVGCSKGTYIRTLCYDIGEKLKCGACMKTLLRTKVDKYTLEDCIKIEDLDNKEKVEEHLVSIEQIFSKYKPLYLKEQGERFLNNGNKLSVSDIKNLENLNENEIYRVYNTNNEFKALYKMIDETTLKPEKMFLG